MIALLFFALDKQPKKLNFQIFFLPLRDLLVASFNECVHLRQECSWTRYSNPKLIKNIPNFLVASPVFALKTQPKNLSFHNFFISKWIASGYFQGNVCTHFQNKLAEKGVTIPKLSKTLRLLWSHSPFFALEKSLKIAKVWWFFSLKNPFLATFI